MINIDLVQSIFKKKKIKLEPECQYTFNIDNRLYSQILFGVSSYEEYLERDTKYIDKPNILFEYSNLIMSLGIDVMPPEFLDIFYNEFMDLLYNRKFAILFPEKYRYDRTTITKEFFFETFKEFYNKFLNNNNFIGADLIKEFIGHFVNILRKS